MRQVFKRIPVYTGDVSGVCSALYELGGMVVMHDPSGCNSTYNTHDEIRWYDRDSLIFLSGLNEMDAIMGSDEALIHDIVEAAEIYHPAFIAIANSPIPYITGMDFDAICRLIEKQTGIPSFYISTNGMHDYTRGAGLAFLHLAERFVEKPAEDPLSGSPANASADEPDVSEISCNILGMTPLDFAAPTSAASLRDKVSKAGMQINACWAMDDTLDRIRRSASAQVNLLVSSTGLPTAEYMYRSFGIPYVAGFPAAGTEDLYFHAVREAAETGRNHFPFRDPGEKECREIHVGDHTVDHTIRSDAPKGKIPAGDHTVDHTIRSDAPKREIPAGGLAGDRMGPAAEPPAGSFAETSAEPSAESPEDRVFCLIGEPVLMISLAASIRLRTGARTCVLAATEGCESFLGRQDRALTGEEELQDALEHLREENKVYVIADPCYEDIIPPGCRLVRLPHLAFSGRIWLKEIPDLCQWIL